MAINFCLNCRDIAVSRAFYAAIAWISDDFAREDGSRSFEMALADGVFLKVVESPRESTGNASLEFLSFDVPALTLRVRGVIPEHGGIVDTLPAGEFCGPYEFPGGMLLSIRDPDGHLLSFAEW